MGMAGQIDELYQVGKKIHTTKCLGEGYAYDLIHDEVAQGVKRISCCPG